MSERFIVDDAGTLIDMVTGENFDIVEEVVDLLNKLNDEVMDLRAENTRFKLIVSDIVDDLEKQAKSEKPIIISRKYVDWIKKELDLRLYSDKGDFE